jgi:hypothetical protein
MQPVVSKTMSRRQADAAPPQEPIGEAERSETESSEPVEHPGERTPEEAGYGYGV